MPICDNRYYFKNVIQAVLNQTYVNLEIIIVNTCLQHEDILNLPSDARLRVIKLSGAFPGRARNAALEIARGEFIAFIDASTVPSQNWVADSLEIINSQNVAGVRGKGVAIANTFQQKIIKASSYGGDTFECLPGTVICKKVISNAGFFINNVRSGEDLEWFQRLRALEIKLHPLSHYVIEYHGLPVTFISALKKWYRYSLSNAEVNILQSQKTAYLIILLSFFLYFAYSWNFVSTESAWDQSVYFVPNLNTYLWSLLLTLYFFYRAIFLPIKKNEKIFFILPFYWVFIGLLSLSLDIIKLPGKILSVIKILKN